NRRINMPEGRRRRFLRLMRVRRSMWLSAEFIFRFVLHANLDALSCLQRLPMRKAAISAGAVLLLVLLTALLAGLWVQRTLTAAGFEQLHWQQLRWLDGVVQVGQLNGVNVSEQGRLGFRLGDIRLQPVWDGGPRIDQLVVDELQLVWEPRDNLPPSEPTDESWSLPELDQFTGPLSWL